MGPHHGTTTPGGIARVLELMSLKRSDAKEYQKSTLPSGLRVVTEEIPHVRSVAMGFWISSGSGYEEQAQSGHSHIIEHMLFKGTDSRSARQIAESVEGLGGRMNAGTGREYTCLYARVMDEHFPAVFEVLSDMILSPRFDADDLEREKKVVTEEIRMYHDSPDELAHDLLMGALWPGHPLSRSILGTLDTVEATTRESLISYHSGHYVPGRTVVAVAGNVTHEVVMEHVSRWLGDWTGNSSCATIKPPEPSSQAVIRKRDIEQVHICLGSQGPSLSDRLLYPTMVLNSIIGGGTSSRLFQAVREESGLAYSVYSFLAAMKDAGLAGIYAATGPDTAGDALDLIGRELDSIRRDGVDAVELERTREHLKGNLMLSLEGTGARMHRLGKSELSLGRIISPDMLIERIDGVSMDDLDEVAQTLFRPGEIALSAVGPVPDNIEEQIKSWEGNK